MRKIVVGFIAALAMSGASLAVAPASAVPDSDGVQVVPMSKDPRCVFFPWVAHCK